jgi:hypothetical protein
VFLGQQATADGTKSTPTPANGGTYTWALAAPTGSSLTTANLQGGSTPTVTFTPDVAGEYSLELTVGAFGTTDSKVAKVEAVLPQVFYAKGQITDAGASAFYASVDFDGGNPHPVLCPDNVVTSVPNEIATLAAYAGRAYDFWESASQPSRLAGFMMNYQAGVGYSSELYVTTATASCDGGGSTPYPSSTFGPGRPYGSMPHFSPDGSRVALYDSKWNIVTYPGQPGATPPVINNVAKYPINFGQQGLDPSGASALNGYVQEPPRIEWIGTPHADGGVSYSIAFAAPFAIDGGIGWAIQTAPDQGNAQPTTYMTCAGVVPRHFAVLADGSIIASYRQTATGPEDLVHLAVNGGQCKQLTNYTSLPNDSTAVATDFDVSPDGTTIAFLKIDPTTQDASPWAQGTSQLPGGYVYSVPVVGGSPSQIAVEPAIYGPRFVGAGGWIVFTRLDGVAGTGTVGSGQQVAASVVIKKTNGGLPRAVATGDGVSTFVSSSGSGSCSAGPGAGLGRRAAPWAMGFIGLLAFARVLRRRLR